MLPYLLLSIVLAVHSTLDHPDRVINLPGAPSEPSFPLYSGYIDVGVTERQAYLNQTGKLLKVAYRDRNSTHSIFYVLCEAIRVDPLEAPLVVWLNGGPGASSLIGFLLENGPYIVQSNSSSLRYNAFSWNQYANILYIESPSSVGFSRVDVKFWDYNDDFTADLNTKVLHEFMNSVHPRYANRDFFITGESYGGVFVPYFARAILSALRDGNFTNSNFEGIAMGNAVVDTISRRISSFIQMFAMGMLPQKFGSKLLQQWEEAQSGKQVHLDMELWLYYDEWLESLLSMSTNYNLHLACEERSSDETWHLYQTTNPLECNALDDISHYLNRDDVQRSLHVNMSGNKTVDWKPLWAKRRTEYPESDDTVPLYSEIFEMAKDGFRVLYYTGDLDLVCPALHVAHGTTRIAEANNMKETADSPKLWTYLGDFGGAQTSYRLNNRNITMDVLTVRGAGHLVNVNHPARAFQIMNNFLFSTDTHIDYSAKIRRHNGVPIKPIV